MSVSVFSINSNVARYLKNGNYICKLRENKLIISNENNEWIVGEGSFDQLTVLNYPFIENNSVILKNATLIDCLKSNVGMLQLIIDNCKTYLTKEAMLNDTDIQETFNSRYSSIDHNHDNVYASIDHNHDNVYASIDHNHDNT